LSRSFSAMWPPFLGYNAKPRVLFPWFSAAVLLAPDEGLEPPRTGFKAPLATVT
jgi:hypothetical protein